MERDERYPEPPPDRRPFTAGELGRVQAEDARIQRVRAALQNGLSGEQRGACEEIITEATHSVAEDVKTLLPEAVKEGIELSVFLARLIRPIWNEHKAALKEYVTYDAFRIAICAGENSEFTGRISINEYIARETGRRITIKARWEQVPALIPALLGARQPIAEVAPMPPADEPTAPTPEEAEPVNKQRIREFRARVSRDSGRRLTNKDIWSSLGGYKNATQFEKWQRDPACSDESKVAFDRILSYPTDQVILLLNHNPAPTNPRSMRKKNG